MADTPIRDVPDDVVAFVKCRPPRTTCSLEKARSHLVLEGRLRQRVIGGEDQRAAGGFLPGSLRCASCDPGVAYWTWTPPRRSRARRPG